MSNSRQQSSSASTKSHQTSVQQHFSSLAPAPLSALLSDSAGHTILSTTESQRQTEALQSLTQAYLAAHDTASRMGLGTPMRITMTTREGATVIQTSTETDGGQAVIGTVMAPENRVAEARVASQGVMEVGKKFGKIVFEGRQSQ